MLQSFDLPHLTFSLTDLMRLGEIQLPPTICVNGENEIERLREPYKLKDLLIAFGFWNYPLTKEDKRRVAR